MSMPGEGKTKPRVGIDTNVFVSGLTFKGQPREVLDLAWKGEIEVYISPFILKELTGTLKKDFGWSNEQIRHTIQMKPIKVLGCQRLNAVNQLRRDF